MIHYVVTAIEDDYDGGLIGVIGVFSLYALAHELASDAAEIHRKARAEYDSEIYHIADTDELLRKIHASDAIMDYFELMYGSTRADCYQEHGWVDRWVSFDVHVVET